MLVVVNRGACLDEELAALRIGGDVDQVVCELLKVLWVPDPLPYKPCDDGLLKLAVPPSQGEPRAPWTIAAHVQA